jgi:hypothetical protein
LTTLRNEIYGDNINSISNEKFLEEERDKNNIKTLTPLKAISVITLVGLVCVIIDYYLEKE